MRVCIRSTLRYHQGAVAVSEPMPASRGQYGPQSDLPSYIYGITFEIWEERGIELIRQYYAADIRVFALGGVSDGVEAVVQSTRDTLAAFPDRLLIAENVIWSDDGDGQYSSHRIMSPMTNSGDSAYGPATNKRVFVRTVADCFVENGVITREWLIRDTLPIVNQLGFDPIPVAREAQATMTEATMGYFASESDRRKSLSDHSLSGWALAALRARWSGGDDLAEYFAPFAVSYPGPLDIVSGREGIREHGRSLADALAPESIRVDHIASQPWAHDGEEVAVRWTMTINHNGDYLGLPASGKRAFILGATHWRIVGGKVLTEWMVFDGMGVLTQLV